jgi:putative transposase
VLKAALHRRSIRLPGYDYAQPGAYFVTIVAAGRQCLFGHIEEGRMQLSDAGKVAQEQWAKLPGRFPMLELGAYVVMPNHVHGILVVNDHSRRGTAEDLQNLEDDPSRRRGTAEDLQNLDDNSSRRAPTEEFGKPRPGSISTIVRSYKAAVTFRIHLMRGTSNTPLWQRNYYEHIIRDDKDWQRIHKYVESNPAMWEQDQENPRVDTR